MVEKTPIIGEEERTMSREARSLLSSSLNNPIIYNSEGEMEEDGVFNIIGIYIYTFIYFIIIIIIISVCIIILLLLYKILLLQYDTALAL